MLRTITTHVAGVTFPNPDGTSRQAIISNCRAGEPVNLEREPDNPHDSRAVKVSRLSGEQIGYLSAGLVGNDQGIGWCIARRMDEGIEVVGWISNVTGESPLGVNLTLTFWDGDPKEQPAGFLALHEPASGIEPERPASFNWFLVVIFVLIVALILLNVTK